MAETAPDPNPYAPPQAPVAAESATIIWQVDGCGLLARSGAVLPQVDLETGETEPPMTASLRNRHSSRNIKVILITLGLLFAIAMRNLSPGWVVTLLIVLMVVLWVLRLGGIIEPMITVTEFVGPRRRRGVLARRKWRDRGSFWIFLALIGMTWALASGLGGRGGYAVFLFLSLIAILFGLALWGTLDRPKAKTRGGPPGWLRIDPVHPDALAYLRALEMEKMAARDPGIRPRKVRVYTNYYYRYPMRLLLGRNWKNPWYVLQLFLMKLLRSRLLERDSFDFSEATPLAREELCAPAAEAMADWLRDHPDWTFVRALRFETPMGDVISEEAMLVSPDLAHVLAITRAWAAAKPEQGNTLHSFFSWSPGESVLRTHSERTLGLTDSHLREFHATGSPEEMLGKHLQHLGGTPPSPAADFPTLLDRLATLQERTSRLMIERGLRTEAREIDL